MKKYIGLNTELRVKSQIDFQKDILKVMVNSVFWKTMENIRKRLNIRLVSNERSLKKLTAKPNFKSLSICSEIYVLFI